MLLAVAMFVGSAACQPCHRQIFQEYAKTPMAQSSGTVASIADADFTAGALRYRIRGSKLLFESGSVPFAYSVGSKRAGQSYLFQREGYVYEMPVTWYAQSQTWDASPGYEHEPAVKLDRAIDTSCLLCHASRLQSVYGTQNRYATPAFLDNGVSCERCHGPGSEHVANPAAAKMVNPETLAKEERDSVCAQCHLTGDARVGRPGRNFGEFRAGMALAEVATYFVWSGKTSEARVTSHVENLAMSRCFNESGGRLWCGTCHEPHTNANRTQAACLSCHADAHHQEQQCARCHMPRVAASDVTHGVTTDHSIRWSTRTAHSDGALTALVGKPDNRSLGLAYAELEDRRAETLLRAAEVMDAPVLIRLAALEKTSASAARFYERALALEPANIIALINLGAIYGNSGRTVKAAELWRRALEANPALEGAVMNLAKVSPPDKAREVLDRYLEFNPASTTAKEARKAFLP